MKKLNSILLLITLCILGTTAQTLNKQHDTDKVLNHNCLSEGTQILMANETMVNIEDIRKGNTIVVFDPVQQAYTTRRVKDIHLSAHARVYRLTLKDGTQVITTDDHPFLTPEGWKSLSPEKTKKNKNYDQVWEYGIGDDIYIYDTDARTSSSLVMIEGIIEATRTYSLELDGNGAYIANYMLAGQE